jgi:hypothetical protein
MPAVDILTELKARSIEGVMFHDKMREYFLYLGLHGYVAMHSFHETEERLGAEKLTDYFMAQNGSLIPDKALTAPDVIPAQWYRMRRQDTDAQWRRRAVRDGMTAWRDWEKGTAVFLKDIIFRLASENETTYSRIAEQKLSDVESEIAGVEEIIFDLESIEYSLPIIIEKQPDIEKKYLTKITFLMTPVCTLGI